eukprot:GCRY01000556.1.p1 GENE.GCRY01000556.1~~GCRY01000556.1.p1  ORF type:complete len:108 (+),score=14.38 GCRY01000556.1:115-438(+)
MSTLSVFLSNYQNTTPQKLKLIDSFLVSILFAGIAVFCYCCLVGTFPFNAFLSGFGCTVGVFVLAIGLRLQCDPESSEFSHIGPERAFADFVMCSLILFLVAMNFVG